MDDLDFSGLDLLFDDDLPSGRPGRRGRKAQAQARVALQAARDLGHDPALNRLADLLAEGDDEDDQDD